MTDDFVSGTGIIPDKDTADDADFDPDSVDSDDFLDDEVEGDVLLGATDLDTPLVADTDDDDDDLLEDE